MSLKIRVLFICGLSLFITVLSQDCSKETTLFDIKRSIYDFSVRLLDKVATETDYHFVYSPVSTWLQLTALAEGASGRTLAEIWSVTRLIGQRRQLCYRRKLKELLNDMKELKFESKRTSVIIVDKLYKVKESFKSKVEALDDVKVLSLDFDNPEESAAEVNDLIDANTGGTIDETVFPNDFDMSVLLMADASYFKSDWKFPFNPVYTEIKTFYSNEGVEIGAVNMMNQIAEFSYVEIPLINAKVLQLPCTDNRVSMLVFLPMENSIEDVYYLLKHTSLLGVYNKLKLEGKKWVNASIPRFDIKLNLEMRELLFDMGVKRVFYPHAAQLKGISNFTINASMLAQVAKIEVTESYVLASAGPESVIKADPDDVIDFNANKPFAFMLVDRKTEFTLFAGMYSEPSLY